MERFQVVFNLLKILIESKSEWYFSYRVVALMLFFFLDFGIVWLIFGNSVITVILFSILKMLIIIHVLFAMLNILKDYVYNESIFYFYKLLVILIIIKIGCYFIL